MSRHVGIGKETTWGTPVAPTTVFIEATAETIQTEPTLIQTKTLRSNSVRSVDFASSLVRGGFSGPANYQEIGYLLYLMYGDVDTTGGSDPYTHTIPGSTGIADRPSCTIEVKRDTATQTSRYAGCKITSFQLAQGDPGGGEGTTFSAEFIGASEGITGVAATASFLDLDLILPKHWAVTIAGGTSVCVQNLEININYPVDETGFCLGSTTLTKEPTTSDAMEVTGTFQIVMEDAVMAAEYTDFLAGTKQDFQFLADSGGDETLTVNVNSALIEQMTPHMDGRNRLVSTIAWQAEFDTTATDAAQWILLNGEDVISTFLA